jgi:DNA-binding response OmpR family regulator
MGKVIVGVLQSAAREKSSFASFAYANRCLVIPLTPPEHKPGVGRPNATPTTHRLATRIDVVILAKIGWIFGSGRPVRVLVVEDERQLADSIAEGLRLHAMAVDVAYDGEAGLERASVNDYDVLVLDRDLPIVSGDEVCATLVQSDSETRILMLTAATAVSQRVAGLGIGADDYLTKPFAFAELVARVQALARRARPAIPPVLERSGIRLDTHRRTVLRDSRAVDLSRKEFAVLEELMRADGGVVSAEQLLEKAWDEQIDPFTNVVRFTVMNVRRKLGDPPVIETVQGVGYRLK